jgi:hypothetical protein
MVKTGKQVQSDVIKLLERSVLRQYVSGEIYRNGFRPRNSEKEDIIVTFTTGIPDQIQEGTVTINIYVPDIDPFANGVLVENGARCEELECIANDWVDSFTPALEYKFKLKQTIYTEAEPAINQHFVVVKLDYQLLD